MSGPSQDFVIFGSLIGPLKTPGKAWITGLGTPRKWQENAGFGLGGATTLFTGIGIAHFSVMLYLYEDAHWIDWEVLARACLSKPPVGIRAVAIGISHPVLTTPPYSIDAVGIEDVIIPSEDDDYGGREIEIKLIEYRKPLPMLGKPLAAIPAASKALPSVTDAADAAIKAKLDTLGKLAGG